MDRRPDELIFDSRFFKNVLVGMENVKFALGLFISRRNRSNRLVSPRTSRVNSEQQHFLGSGDDSNLKANYCTNPPIRTNNPKANRCTNPPIKTNNLKANRCTAFCVWVCPGWIFRFFHYKSRLKMKTPKPARFYPYSFEVSDDNNRPAFCPETLNITQSAVCNNKNS